MSYFRSLFIRTSIVSLVLLLSACNFGNENNNSNQVIEDQTVGGQPSVAVARSPIPPGDADCPHGGILVETGIDENGNGVLDADEVDATEKVCNGAPGPQGEQGPVGTDGIDGIDGTDGAAGPTGPAGPAGADGADGADGVDGQDGIDGQDGADGEDGVDGKEAQTIRFIDQGDEYAFIDDQFTRIAVGGLGDGAISYSSDDPSIASVDPDTGDVNVLTQGKTFIRAHKAADDNYSAANDFYMLSAIPREIPFSATVRFEEGAVSFPETANGLPLYRSTDRACDLDNYSICPNGTLDILTGEDIEDTSLLSHRANTFWIKHGEQQSRETTVSFDELPPRDHYQMLAFNNGHGERLWLIGGGGWNNIPHYNDVWSSADGTNWIRETSAAAFPPRMQHQLVKFNDGRGDRLWLIGGGGSDQENDYRRLNDVWSSSDGVNWTEEVTSAAFSGRTEHQVVVFNDGRGERLWLIGGRDSDSHKNDIWSSADGVNWIEETPAAAFSPRSDHRVVHFNDGFSDKLWLIGGGSGTSLGGRKNDVWSSVDGVNWKQESSTTAFPPRYSPQVLKFNDGRGERLWLFGGYFFVGLSTTLEIKDVWSSADGITWVEETATAAFSQLKGHQVVHFNNGSGNTLWLMGGSKDYAVPWSSPDGVSWSKATTTVTFSPRDAHQVIPFNNGSGDKLWLIGGSETYGHIEKTDIWSSTDGINWTEETTSTNFSPRSAHKVIYFNNGGGERLWLIGGQDADGIKNDVWSSTDGVSWTEETAAAAFSPRTGFQVVNFDDGRGDRLWVIGGEESYSSYKNDVWSSADGITWIEESSGTAFSPRSGHQVVVFNDGRGDRLWVIGGIDGYSSYKNDVWSSTDGITWIEESSAAAFSPRVNHPVLIFNDGRGDRLWLIGGHDHLSENNDVWSSDDGVTWIEETDAAAFPPRRGNHVVHFNDGSGDALWLTGGRIDGLDLNDVWASRNGVNWWQMKKANSTIRFDNGIE